MDNEFKYGERLKFFRRKLNLSQEKMALEAGITTVHYGQIERGKANPTISVLEKICEVMGISLSDIFSESSTNIFNIDPISMQILHQLRGKSEREKELALSLIKTAFKLQNENKK